MADHSLQFERDLAERDRRTAEAAIRYALTHRQTFHTEGEPLTPDHRQGPYVMRMERMKTGTIYEPEQLEIERLVRAVTASFLAGEGDS